MSLRSSRPRLMMHVFFAPRLFLIPLSSLSYDRRFVFFFVSYITLQDLMSFTSNFFVSLFSVSFYGVL